VRGGGGAGVWSADTSFGAMRLAMSCHVRDVPNYLFVGYNVIGCYQTHNNATQARYNMPYIIIGNAIMIVRYHSRKE